MADVFPNSLVGPSSKERKYDRQLRLWAASGQQALEEARVLLVSSDGYLDKQKTAAVSGVVGVEALKNLALPGVGGFTIVDPAVVTEADLGVNFFLEQDSLGKCRAAETCRLLRELNPDVQGSFSAKPITELLQDQSRDFDFLALHKLVVACGPMKQSTREMLFSAARERGIPLLYVRSVGFYSCFSLQLPAQFPIVETHPDAESTQDLRLRNPWPELAAAAAGIANLADMDDHEHGHVPYVLLLLHYLEKWKETHSGQLPSNYKEKAEFREMVRAGARTQTPEGGEENFDEAVAAVLKTLNPFSLPASVRDIFDAAQCQSPTAASANFWIIAAAVRAFYQRHQELPLPGSLPDMKARSADYVSLQNIYRAKARSDIDEVTQIVRDIEKKLGQQLGQQLGPQGPSIPDKEIEVVCRNAAHIRVIQGRDIPQLDTAAADPFTLAKVRGEITDTDDSLMPIFVAFEILDAVVDDIQTAANGQASIADGDTWTRHTDRILQVLHPDVTRRHIATAIQELQRAEAGELHNISSLTGGLVAQEALKVLTRQYVPLDNTCIFDGVKSRSEMHRL